MGVTGQLLTLRERGESLGDDYLHPLIKADGSLKTAASETLLWSGRINEIFVGIFRKRNGEASYPTAWSLENPLLLLTESRLVYTCERFDRDKFSGWDVLDFGVGTVIRNLDSRIRYRNLTAAGHIRYAWPYWLGAKRARQKARFRTTWVGELNVVLQDDDEVLQIVMHFPEDLIFEVTRVFVTSMAKWRLEHIGPDLDDKGQQLLRSLVENFDGHVRDEKISVDAMPGYKRIGVDE